jgi:uncharacterized protein (TIGR01777 family)
MRVLVAGGTGFIGTALVDALLARGDSVVLQTRDARKARPGVELRVWDGKDPGPWASALDGADAIVNLAGENIAGARWTPERKLQLIRSRVDSTRALVSAMSSSPRKPRVFLSASAVGYYGLRPAGDCAEGAAQGTDFLAALCGQWEREARAAEKLGVRVVLLRTGVVLGRGGALAKMRLPFKLGLGGPLGDGTQPFPWIHLDDEVGAILFALDAPALAGPVNLAAPHLASNADFASALGRAYMRPAVLPAPAFALRLALGEMAEMLLGGQRALPRKLEEAGYAFRHPYLDEALSSLA